MGMLGRIGSFLAGGALGAGVGAAIAFLTAPQSGDEFRQGIERRVDQVRIAGIEAQARTEEELIRRFRADIGDPGALRDEATQTRIESAQAIADLGLPPSIREASGAGGSHHS